MLYPTNSVQSNDKTPQPSETANEEAQAGGEEGETHEDFTADIDAQDEACDCDSITLSKAEGELVKYLSVDAASLMAQHLYTNDSPTLGRPVSSPSSEISSLDLLSLEALTECGS